MWSACLRSKGCPSSAWHEHAYGMSMSVRTESFLLRTLAHVYTPLHAKNRVPLFQGI